MRSEEATAEVTVQDAYDAAEERAVKTTRALILAEAQIRQWKRRYVEAENRAQALEREIIDMGGRTTSEEVWDAEGESSGAASGSEADCPG